MLRLEHDLIAIVQPNITDAELEAIDSQDWNYKLVEGAKKALPPPLTQSHERGYDSLELTLMIATMAPFIGEAVPFLKGLDLAIREGGIHAVFKGWTKAIPKLDHLPEVPLAAPEIPSVAPIVKAPAARTLSEWLPGLSDDALIHLSDATVAELMPGVFTDSYWVRFGDVKHLTVPLYKSDVVLPHAPAYSPEAKVFSIIEKPDLNLFKTSREHGIALEYQNIKPIIPDKAIEIDPLPAHKPPPLSPPPVKDAPVKQQWWPGDD